MLRMENKSENESWRDGRWEDFDINEYWRHFPQPPHSVNVFVGLALVVITLLAAVSNALVLYVYWKWGVFQLGINKNLNPSLRLYIFALSMGDFLGPLTTNWLMFISSFRDVWLFGNGGCWLYGFVQGYCSLQSILLISAIAFKRAFSVLFPFRARDWNRTNIYDYAIITTLSSYAFLLAAPPLVGWSHFVVEGFGTSCCFEFLDRSFGVRSYIVWLFVGGFFIPIGVIFPSCSVIVRFLLQKAAGKTPTVQKKLTPNTESDYSSITPTPTMNRHSSMRGRGSRGREREQRNIALQRIVLLIPTMFLMVWSPYAFITFCAQFGPPSRPFVGPYLLTFSSIFAKTSTFTNPAIYAFLDRTFLECLKKSMESIRKKGFLARTDMSSGKDSNIIRGSTANGKEEVFL